MCLNTNDCLKTKLLHLVVMRALKNGYVTVQGMFLTTIIKQSMNVAK